MTDKPFSLDPLADIILTRDAYHMMKVATQEAADVLALINERERSLGLELNGQTLAEKVQDLFLRLEGALGRVEELEPGMTDADWHDYIATIEKAHLASDSYGNDDNTAQADDPGDLLF